MERKSFFSHSFAIIILLICFFCTCEIVAAACSVSDCHTTGGAITTSGNYCIHKFTSSGIFTVPSGVTLNTQVLVVAGGGSGGGGYASSNTGRGGGGAGGLIYNNSFAVSAGNISVTVGSGGASVLGRIGLTGSKSVFSSIIAYGGGGGSGCNVDIPSTCGPGGNGGSGGGASAWGDPGIATPPGQGTNGNECPNGCGFDLGGTGGGLAYVSSISGTSTTYAIGGPNTCPVTNGAANTGNGGGGIQPSCLNGGYSGAGGSGIVIVRYYQNTTDGIWSGFGSWYDTSDWSVCSSCSQSKSQRRDRTCTPPVCGGAACSGSSYEIRTISQACGDVNGFWSGWVNSGICGEYQDCKQKQVRNCTPPVCGGTPCSGVSEQYIDCARVDGNWSNWINSGACGSILACKQKQVRDCNNPVPVCGGTPCPGVSEQYLNCGLVNGFWSGWVNSGICGEYQDCKQKQVRNCTPPVCGGTPCSGVSEQTVNCGLVNGFWSGWVNSGICGQYQPNKQKQVRTCSNPIPACGGTTCTGINEQYLSCGLTNISSIIDLNVSILNDGNFLVGIECSLVTKADLNFIETQAGLIIPITPMTVDCNSGLTNYKVKPLSKITADKLVTIQANIANYASDCKVCIRQAFVSYQNYSSQTQQPVPDNNYLSIMALLAIVMFVLLKKRI